jgi:hypothetical protein
VAVLLAIFGLFLWMPKNSQNQDVITSNSTMISPTESEYLPTPTSRPMQFPKEYVKKLFDENEMIQGSNFDHTQKKLTAYYPSKIQRLIDYPEDKLVGLKCLSTTILNKEINVMEPVTNPRLVETNKIVQALNSSHKKYNLKIICDTENSETFVGYVEMNNPYDFKIVYHLAWLEGDKILLLLPQILVIPVVVAH